MVTDPSRRSHIGAASAVSISDILRAGRRRLRVAFTCAVDRRADDVVMVLDVEPLESGLTERGTIDTMIDIALNRAEK
jgi:hypothetical protein